MKNFICAGCGYFYTANEPQPCPACPPRIVNDRHPNSARFHELREELGELHDQKQADYGRGDDPFANVRVSSDWGMPSWVGAMIRATDKVRRLQTFARKGELRNEAVIDAFMDLACYALIARVLYEEEQADADRDGFA